MESSALQHRVRSLIEPSLERLGYELVAVEWVAGRRGTLRLSIDKVGGVGADDCARVSFRVSPLLDEADPIASAYDLEVSSPGIDRPVQRLVDFERFVGFRIRVRAEEGLPRRRWTGTLKGVQGSTVVVEVDGTDHLIEFSTIEAAHLVLDLEAYQKLAEGPPPIPVAEALAPHAGGNTAPAEQEEA